VGENHRENICHQPDESIIDGRIYYLTDLNDKDVKVSERIVCRFNFNRQDEMADLKQGSIAVFYGRIDDLKSTKTNICR
jgi:hypothetical protein